jgi:hypothetical protein
MFRLVESLYQEPIRFPINPGSRLVPGNVVSVLDYNGNLVIDLCDGYKPLGLVGNRCWGGYQLSFQRTAKVYPQRMIADVAKFDRQSKIEAGASLYCNQRGVLTADPPHEWSIVLAKVISPASDEKNYMQILWL